MIELQEYVLENGETKELGVIIFEELKKMKKE